MASLAEVEKLMKGGGARVQRWGEMCFATPADACSAASAPAPLNLLVKLLQGNAGGRIRIKVRIAPKRLRNPLVLIVKNGWKRPNQVDRQYCSFRIRQIQRKLLDFSDSCHQK